MDPRRSESETALRALRAGLQELETAAADLERRLRARPGGRAGRVAAGRVVAGSSAAEPPPLQGVARRAGWGRLVDVARGAWRRWLRGWLTGAVLVLGPGGADAATEPPATVERAGPTRLKLATWNIEWLSRRDGDGKVPRTEQDYARLRKYARLLDADIVALQEVDGDQAAARVFDPRVYAFHFTGDADHVQRTGFAFKRLLTVTVNPDLIGLAVNGTRRAADITVTLGRSRLRLLSIHLKSGCWGAPLETDLPACRTLRKQLPVLESWIDARGRARVPFAVAGDFNRRFGPSDTFWPEIDDGEPPDAVLTDAGRGRRSQCWGGEYPEYVDKIVLGRSAALWLVPHSFEQILFEPADVPYKATLSDHCPIAMTLDLGASP